MTFSYVRLYSDDEGESHFDEVEAPLELTDFAPPAAPLNFAPLGAAAAIALMDADSTWDGGNAHPAPARQFMTSLDGEVEVTASDGTTRRIGQGDLLLIEDTAGRGIPAGSCPTGPRSSSSVSAPCSVAS